MKNFVLLKLRNNTDFIKFAAVGLLTFVIDMSIYYSLTMIVLPDKPTAAKVFAGTIATIASYIFNREWSFRDRSGRPVHHEALLFFIISGIAVVIAALPIFIFNNIHDVRSTGNTVNLIVIDFFLNYIIGNLLQMIFRFWALKKYVFLHKE